MGFMQQFSQPQRMSQEQAMREAQALGRLLKADTQGMLVRAMRSNPSFVQFMEANRGKTIEQAFSDNGYDVSALRSALGPTR